MALTLESGIIDGSAFTNAAHNVLQDSPLWDMKKHVIGCNRGNAATASQIGNLGQAQLVTRPSPGMRAAMAS